MYIVKLKETIEAARGARPLDLMLKGGSVVNIVTGEVEKKDILIYRDRIVGVVDGSESKGYSAKEVIDVSGMYLTPGFIESHVHIESSMVTPSEFARGVLPRGTTTVIADPHEIANVMGTEGILFMAKDAAKTPMDIYFSLPSCVPATEMETSGARLTSKELESLIDEPWVIGLGEVMNFPGVINGEEELLKKIKLAKEAGKAVDGHAPLVSGRDLTAYLAAGIGSDHESSRYEEGKEKLEKGMFLMIREGSHAKNLEDLLPLINEKNFQSATFVADDIDPNDIINRGHIDYFLKKAVSLGLDPTIAVRMVTLSPASYFGLSEIGILAPSKRADIIVLENLKDFNVKMVFKNGRLVADEKGAIFEREEQHYDTASTMNVSLVGVESIRVPWEEGEARVIKIAENQIITDEIHLKLKAEDGFAVSDIERDILKVAVFERHRGTGNIGLGFVNGFGLKEGAIASSIGHDSHNIISVGVADDDIYLAVRRIVELKGGQVIVKGGRVVSELQLEVAGLMSHLPLIEVDKRIEKNLEESKNVGCAIDTPFMMLSFLPLPVIPKLKITDKGLFDVTEFKIVPLYL
ncbi:MAG: adenine deaminase [Deltaproteobacteria bacterium]|uniref:Adenine deaminase n=1 Tax=Candidatus Zymogenus saltonus TaxID=2844893 RepID=A0A9D8KHY7_9DELT|nr:adenine deaminase [Candidatus Zymogenus saltonus]